MKQCALLHPPRLVALASVVLCLSCAPVSHRRAPGTSTFHRIVANSLIVRSTLANVTRLRRPVRWALAINLSAVPIRDVVFAVDGHVVGIARRPPWSCCGRRASYLAGLPDGPHTFVCTVVTTDRRIGRETVTATVTSHSVK